MKIGMHLGNATACQISERLERFITESHGFEALRDLAVRSPPALWIEALVPNRWQINTQTNDDEVPSCIYSLTSPKLLIHVGLWLSYTGC